MLAEKSSTYDQRLEKNWEWATKYFYRKTKDFGLEAWVLGMDNQKTTLGHCMYSQRKISLSSHFLRGPSCDEKKIRNTILHEMAHALVGPEHNHDEVWKKMAIKIGSDGKRCGTMDMPDARYVLECPNRCFSQTYYRRPKTTNKVCMKCKSPPILKILK
jgi:predicted SprT family Zn-dependent metalloprotease